MVNDHIIAERNEGLQAVARGMAELNECFRDFAEIVREQQTNIDTIERNVESAHTSVQQSARLVEEVAEKQKKSTALSCEYMV